MYLALVQRQLAGREDRLRVLAMGVLRPQHQHALSVEAKDQAVRQIGHVAFVLIARTDRPRQWHLADCFHTTLDVLRLLRQDRPRSRRVPFKSSFVSLGVWWVYLACGFPYEFALRVSTATLRVVRALA